MLYLTYLIQNYNSDDISHKQRECVSGARAEILPMHSTHYICILIYEFKETLQTPEEALATAHDATRERVVELL